MSRDFIETASRPGAERAIPLAARRRTPVAGEPSAPLIGGEGTELRLGGKIVGLLSRRTTRAPRRARAIVGDDLAVVSLYGTLTAHETALAARGHAALVMRTREAIYEAMREDATAAVEAVTGRRVTGYLARQRHDIDLAVLMFAFDSFPAAAA